MDKKSKGAQEILKIYSGQNGKVILIVSGK